MIKNVNGKGKVVPYNKFVYGGMDGSVNRTISPSIVKSKVESIKKFGLLSPITVIMNGGMLYVVDGQHRIEACKEMNFPIHESNLNVLDIGDKNVIDVMSEMNNNLAKWKGMDFIDVFAKEGRDIYVTISNFITSYPKFKLTGYVAILGVGASHNDRVYKITRYHLEKGDFEIPDLDMSIRVADDLMRVSKHTPFFKHFQFIPAFIRLWKKPQFNIDTFVSQLKKGKHKKNGTDIFMGVANRSTFEDLIRQVYNDRLRGGEAFKI